MKQLVLQIGTVDCSPSPKELAVCLHQSFISLLRGVSTCCWSFCSIATLLYLLVVFNAFILRAGISQMWMEDAVRIRPHRKPLLWQKNIYESLAFLSSTSISLCNFFLFYFWPEFIPVHCKNKPNICKRRIKMEIPFKALGLEHGVPVRNQHQQCRSSLRISSETVGCICATKLVWPTLYRGGSGA